jgi:hypothetical protein
MANILDPLQQRPDNLDRVSANRARDRYEFDNVETPLTAFILCNKGLGPFQSLGELLLGELGALSRSDHQLAKGEMSRRTQRLSDIARARSHARQ